MTRRSLAILAAALLVGAAAAALVLGRGHGQRPQAPPPVPTTRSRRHLPRPSHPAFSWPVYGFDPARTHSAPLRLRPPFRTVWKVYGDSSFIEFPPVLAAGRLFFGTNHGLVLAVQAASGRIAWHRQFAGCIASSPAVGNGVVYIGFMDPPPCSDSAPSFLAALDARDGRMLWRFRAGVIESSPLLAGGRVYFGSWDHHVYALDARTGRLEWSFATGDRVKGGVALAGGTIYAGSYDGYLYALDARGGRLRWTAGGGRLGGLYATPSVAHGRVFVSSTNGRVYAFSLSGNELWSVRTGSYVYSPAALAGRDRVRRFLRPPALCALAGNWPHAVDVRRRRADLGSADGASAALSTSRPAGRARATNPTLGRGERSPSMPRQGGSSGASPTASTAR